MGVRKKDLGKVLGMVDFLTIRQIPKYKTVGTKRVVETSTIAICHAKKIIKDGFKNFDNAYEFASENISKYSKTRHSF